MNQNKPTEASLHFELYHQIRSKYPDLVVKPEHRLKKLHTKGYLVADLFIPALKMIIEMKNHVALNQRETIQRQEYTAYQTQRGYKVLYCMGKGDFSLILHTIGEKQWLVNTADVLKNE